MSEPLKLSDKLNRFKTSYDDTTALATVKSGQTLFSDELKSVSDDIVKILDKFKESGKDNTIDSIISNVTLVKDGVDRVKLHLDDDITNVIGKTAEVRAVIKDLEENLIPTYNDKVKERDSEIGKRDIKTTTPTSTIPVSTADEQKIANLNGEIKKLFYDIDNNTQNAERQIDAIETAINGVDFGIAGNMEAGGSLAPGVLFETNYDFSWKDIPLDEEAIAASTDIPEQESETKAPVVYGKNGGSDGVSFTSREDAIKYYMSDGTSREDAEKIVNSLFDNGLIRIDPTTKSTLPEQDDVLDKEKTKNNIFATEEEAIEYYKKAFGYTDEEAKAKVANAVKDEAIKITGEAKGEDEAEAAAGDPASTEAPEDENDGEPKSTEAPVGSTEAPVGGTQAPVGSTEAPVGSTEAPVGSTEAPIGSTEAPVGSTQAPENNDGNDLDYDPFDVSTGVFTFKNKEDIRKHPNFADLSDEEIESLIPDYIVVENQQPNPEPDPIPEPEPEKKNGYQDYGTGQFIETSPETNPEVNFLNEAKAGNAFKGSTHKGKTNIVAEVSDMRQLKVAMENGQPIILKDVVLSYEWENEWKARGTNVYDATTNEIYFIQDSKGRYRQCTSDGTIIVQPHQENKYMTPELVLESPDVNNSALANGGRTRTVIKKKDENGNLVNADINIDNPTSSGNIRKTFIDAGAGDVFAGDLNGEKIHNGASNVICEVNSNTRQLKDAVLREQPIKLNGVKFPFIDKATGESYTYDATNIPVYLVEKDGYYYRVDTQGNRVDNYKISKDTILIMGDMDLSNVKLSDHEDPNLDWAKYVR